ncbi:hypothetical protein K7X08_000368 [Anisodus acutangulus]|uniref:Uncharacterized protein n=1 Tax=Anisodus acutangulus TaxID=402998 RepID=A0A9Q1M478_9SOLA|nr:hypothetical protein K7X08_000368 [Anisodus acutangulus]
MTRLRLNKKMKNLMTGMSDNKIEESDGGADHKNDGAKEGDEADVGEKYGDELNVGEENKADGEKDGDKVVAFEEDNIDGFEEDNVEVDLVEYDKADGERGGDGVIAVEEENADGENEAEKSDEGAGDQNEGEKDQVTTIEISLVVSFASMLINKFLLRLMQTEVHHFLVPTHQETYQPFMRDFVPLGQDFSDKRIDRLRKEMEWETSITMAEAARGVGDVLCGGSGDGVGPSGSVDVEGVSTGGVGTSRHTFGCNYCVHESPTLNKVLKEVTNI